MMWVRPGNSTGFLAEAFPDARLTGIDSSHAMVDKARRRSEGEIRGRRCHLWTPNPEADLVFSNALFQWVPDHPRHLARILAALKPGATLAIQMPDNLKEPSHYEMAKIATKPAFAENLRKP